MSNNKELGREGEKLAADYLEGLGYALLERNYRSSRAEIDLIAREGDLLVFVEVKSRRDALFGWPEEAVGEEKAEHIRRAAEDYMDLCNWTGEVRYDIIAILWEGGVPSIEHLEDAF